MTKFRTQKDEPLPKIPEDSSQTMNTFFSGLIDKMSSIFRNTRLDLDNIQDQIDVINSGLISRLPAGIISMWGNATAPDGYVLCNGASLLRSGTYAGLFAVIGATFGSADGTHFNVPDFRGVFPKGAGTTTRAAGVDANGNAYASTLGSYYQDMFQGHYHQLKGYRSGSGDVTYYGLYGSSTCKVVDPLSSAYAAVTEITNGTNGTPRTGLTTEPQSLGINFIIKY